MADSARELTDEEIALCVKQVLETKANPVLEDGTVVTQGNITEDSYQKLTKAVLDAAYEAEKQSNSQNNNEEDDEKEEETPESPQTLFSGGVEMHEGFRFVGKFQNLQDDGNTVIQVTDLLPNVRIDKNDTISVSLEQSVQNGPDGRLTCRIIHDGASTGYIFRKDDTETNTTIFSVGFGHMGPPVGN